MTYDDRLRADRAESALFIAEQRLARVLAMVDHWEQTFPEQIRTDVAAESIRKTVLPS